MDLSPQTLREVAFREKLRGYHTEDVDEFVERVASGLEILQERLRQAMDRAVRAEQKAAEVGEGDEAMRRTLVLAQRTADLAIQEAKEQAARIVAQAEAQAQAVRAEAADHARATIDEATREARLRVDHLLTARDELQADVAALGGYLDQERNRLRDLLSDALLHVESTMPAPRPAPPISDIDLDGPPPPVANAAVEPPANDPAPAPDVPLDEDDFFAELHHVAAEASSGE